MSRSLRPPSPMSVAPLVFSQVNVEAGAGLKPWRFLELVAEQNLPHRRLGKLVLVEAAVLLEALRAEPGDSSEEPVEAEVDRVLRSIGRRRVG